MYKLPHTTQTYPASVKHNSLHLLDCAGEASSAFALPGPKKELWGHITLTSTWPSHDHHMTYLSESCWHQKGLVDGREVAERKSMDDGQAEMTTSYLSKFLRSSSYPKEKSKSASSITSTSREFFKCNVWWWLEGEREREEEGGEGGGKGRGRGRGEMQKLCILVRGLQKANHQVCSAWNQNSSTVHYTNNIGWSLQDTWWLLIKL